MTESMARQLGWGDRSAAYSTWRNALNREVYTLASVSLDDLVDCDFASMFEEELSPREAAEVVLNENGCPFTVDSAWGDEA